MLQEICWDWRIRDKYKSGGGRLPRDMEGDPHRCITFSYF